MERAERARWTVPGMWLACTRMTVGPSFASETSGIGIAPDALPHIFDLFKQANVGDPRSRSGLGIGLALVHDLVELHGGMRHRREHRTWAGK
ncbi:MAG: hypothetical protein JWN85_665 [Gammaproteobacteria bacterium]|nr:hypothetical protein [Gammaproteobacteria bacterium]